MKFFWRILETKTNAKCSLFIKLNNFALNEIRQRQNNKNRILYLCLLF